ncbi:MAG: hydrolase [Gammaproteobacteria bacterium]|nr:hydrolase [Gammaproteobacteria bacterium]
MGATRGEFFKPAWWLPGAHLQTLWPHLVRRSPQVALKRERLALPDGDFTDLDWTRPGERGLVVVLHGLEGSSRSHYVRGVLAALERHGFGGVLTHFRGCSGEPNRLARSYNAGDTADLDFVVATLAARHEGLPLFAAGFSLGANVLLKWLGERGAAAPLTAAVAVSPPFDLHKAARRLDAGLSRLYQWALLRQLRRRLERKFRGGVDAPIDLAILPRLLTFPQFDEHVTAPLHGYAGADDYYTRASCRPYIGSIHTPTHIIHALDDPFTLPSAVPRPSELPPHVDLELKTRGGHVGFVGGRLPGRARYWLDERIPRVLARYSVT